jgi:hypothetical protein
MPKNIEKYTNERQELLEKILNILEISEIHKKFSLKELDENLEKQNKILILESEIKKYFICSKWTYFSHKNRKCKRNYLSLIKAIFKNMNIKMLTSVIINKNDNNPTKCETFYSLEY